MSARALRCVLPTIPAALFLIGAAPPPRASLLYDPAVFLAGQCLSPALGKCGAAAASGLPYPSASMALLEAGEEPKLPLDLAGLLDLGPQVTGGAAPTAP